MKTNHAIVVVFGACLGGWVFDTKRDLRMGWGVVVFDKGVVCRSDVFCRVIGVDASFVRIGVGVFGLNRLNA